MAIESGTDVPIRGWLLVLCGYLAIWQPLNLAVAASGALLSLPVRGWPLAAVLVARLGVTALGIGAVKSVVERRPAALGMTRLALVLSLVTELFLYATSIAPNNRVPGDTPLYVAWSLAFHLGWLTYLQRSVRVRRTLR